MLWPTPFFSSRVGTDPELREQEPLRVNFLDPKVACSGVHDCAVENGEQ